MKKKLYVIGDIHFSSLQDWSNELGNKFLSWMKDVNLEGDKESREIVLLGDIVERDINPGDVFKQVFTLFDILRERFSHTYIVIGNHDIKLYKGKLQYAYNFIEKDPDFTVFQKEELHTTKNGFELLALPHRRIDGYSIEDYYSNFLDEKYYNAESHLIVGHVAYKDPMEFFSGVDFNKFNTKQLALGHIHNSSGNLARYYCGSIAPFRTNEVDDSFQRRIRTFSLQDGVFEEEGHIPIPVFIKYKDIVYPDEIVPEPEIISVYTVQNCNSLQKAKDFYSTEYVKAIVVNKKKDEAVDIDSQSVSFLSKKDAFEAMLIEKDLILSRSVKSYIMKLL